MTAIELAEPNLDSVLSTLDQLEAVCPRHRAEFYEGSFHVNPPASAPHNQAILVLAQRLLNNPLPPGYSIVTDSRIHFGPEVMCPDIAVVREAAIKSATGSLAMEADDVLLVAEVRSPSSEHKDTRVVMGICRRLGIDYWLVAPSTRIGVPWESIERFPFGPQSGIDVPDADGPAPAAVDDAE
jgi:Uma2 family endonuclease